MITNQEYEIFVPLLTQGLVAIVAQCDNEQQIVPATASPAEHTCYAGKQQMHTESLLLIKIFRCTNWQTP